MRNICLNTIVKIFEEHKISKYSGLEYEKFNKSERHPSSEGIIFESTNFTGEIFYYSNESSEYLEMGFLIYDGEKLDWKIIDKVILQELDKSISDFLSKKMSELRNFSQK